MARTSIRLALSLNAATLLACANASLPDAPPLTGEGVAGVPTTPSGATGSGGSDSSSSSGGSDTSSSGGPGADTGNPPGSVASAGASSGGSSAVASGGTPSTFDPATDPIPNGYYVAGSWQGQAWLKTSGDGSTIMPASFSDVPFGMPYCAAGSLVALEDYSGTATMGVNLNQGIDAGAAANTLVPTADGVIAKLTNRGASALRLEVRGPNGETDQSQRWCAPISDTGGFVAWSTFNTACWDNSGAEYNREPIVSAAVLVPGDNTDVVTYDVCLNSIGEGMGEAAGGAPSGPSNSGGASAGNPGAGGSPTGGTSAGTAGTGG